MKKVLVFLILGILLINLTLAIGITGSAQTNKKIGENDSDDRENKTGNDDDENEIECDNYNYSSCPTGCFKKCANSDCIDSNGTILADCSCDGKGSCYEKEDKEWKRGNLTKEEIKEAIKEKNRIKFEERTGQNCTDNCICTGVVMKCELEDGTREMTIYAKSGNIIFQVKNVNASTQVTLYHHNKTTYAVFKNNETKEIVLPDKIQEKIREKIKAKIENQNITLNEDGFYEVRMQKRARLFFLFPLREKVQLQLDAENGEVIKLRNPWWGFLAKDIRENSDENVE